LKFRLNVGRPGEASPVPPASIHAHHSPFNFAIHGIAMLRDVHKQLYLWGVLKNFWHSLANSVKKGKEAL